MKHLINSCVFMTTSCDCLVVLNFIFYQKIF